MIQRRNRPSRNQCARRLRLEPLEDRRLLATLTVNSPLDNITPDDNLVTLREAVLAANNDATTDLGHTGSGDDTILFDVVAFAGAQPTLLALGEIEITEDVRIDATELVRNVTINAQRQSRVFNITASSGDFTLAGLTLTGGRVFGENGGAVSSLTSGRLTIDRSAIRGNQSRVGSGSGGGVFSTGDLRLVNTTISDNSTRGSGGGVFAGGTLTVASSTISGNRADGANSDAGGMFSFGNLRITQSTITDNTAGDGGGVGSFGAISMSSSIVAGNSATGLHPDVFPGLGDTTADYSLIGTGVVPAAGGNNVRSNQPLLAELAENGGRTQTHALLGNSQAIDRGDPTIAFDPNEFDQRGSIFSRVVDGGSLGLRIDIGSTERQILPAHYFVVDTITDDLDNVYVPGDVSLREAINAANGSAGTGTITFDPAIFASPQTIALTQGQIVIGGAEVTIEGPGQQFLTIDAQQNSRIFDINATGDVKLAGLTLTGGRTTGASTAGYGGAIRWVYGYDKLTLERCTVSRNSTEGADAHGGAIASFREVMLLESNVIGNIAAGNGGGIYDLFGKVTLMQSSVSGNTSTGHGGGIFSREVALTYSSVSENSGDSGGGIRASEDVTLTQSTVRNNRSAEVGGGILASGNVALTRSTVSGNNADGTQGGGILAAGVTLSHSTVSGNIVAGSDGRGGGIVGLGNATLAHSNVVGNHATGTGGGIFTFGVAMITNSIVSGNLAGTARNEIDPDTGTVSAYFSLIQDTTGLAISGANNITGVDPLLGPLMDNGGPTQTHAPLSGSPAIDQGDPAVPFNADEFDQRGSPFVRNQGGRIDVGAVEFSAQNLGWQNLENANDVDHDGVVSPVDALLVINQLSQPEHADPLTGRLPATRPDVDTPCVDVTGDLFVTPVDALLVINALNPSSTLIANRSRSIDPLPIGLNSHSSFHLESTDDVNDTDADKRLSHLDRFFAKLSA